MAKCGGCHPEMIPISLLQLVCPPELCSIYMLKAPTVGGETLYASAVHAYELLSPEKKAFFETLQCEYRCTVSSFTFAVLQGHFLLF